MMLRIVVACRRTNNVDGVSIKSQQQRQQFERNESFKTHRPHTKDGVIDGEIWEMRELTVSRPSWTKRKEPPQKMRVCAAEQMKLWANPSRSSVHV